MWVRLKGVLVVLGAASLGNGETPAMQRIANRTIACHAVENLAAAGIDELAVVATPGTIDEVRECIERDLGDGITPTYICQHDRIDLLGALGAAAGFVGDDRAVVHLADGLLGQQLDQVADLLHETGPDMLLLLHRSDTGHDELGPATQRLLGVTELNGSPTRLALAGVCVFGPGTMRRAADVGAAFQPEVDLLQIAEHLAAEGNALEAVVVRSWRRYQGNPLDLLELNRVVLDQLHPQGELLHRGDNRIEGRVIISPSAAVDSSIILGPCIIGADARVSNSYIGPYTSIGAGADIEGAEIVRSIISEGARIKHISGRIEGSTIGPRAPIFRDFRLPRAMRLHVGEDVEVALQ